MSWQYAGDTGGGSGSGGGPPKKRFAHQQAASSYSTDFPAPAATANPSHGINLYQSNATVPSSAAAANPYSVTLPTSTTGGVGGPAGYAVAPAYPHNAMSQMHVLNQQQQHHHQQQQQQNQAYLNNMIQQQQMLQQQQLQQRQLQLQQQEQQRRREQIHLAAMAHAQQQQDIQAQAQVQHYHANSNNLSQQMNAQLPQQGVASHNGFQSYQRGDAAAAASEYQTFLNLGGTSTSSAGGVMAMAHQDLGGVGVSLNQSTDVANIANIDHVGVGTVAAPQAPAVSAATTTTTMDTAPPSPSKKRPLPTPIGEHGRSQSMPPDIGRNMGREMSGGDSDANGVEDDPKLSAVEEVESKPAPKVIKSRKPPKPMPITMFQGIVKGGLTKEDIKDHKSDAAAATKTKSKSKPDAKKMDGRPPRVSSSSSLRRASSLPVSKADKKEQERRHRSASASSGGGCSSASEEELNLMDHLPRRRSRRGNAALAHLAEQIVDGKSVVVITGAGLSVGSGIRPFRGKEGLWSTVVWTKATREAFRDDPLDWYNSFWLPHFPPSTYEGHFHPNAGHEVISKLAALSMSDVKVITQNVDGLHSATKQDWDWSDRLIEAHGRLGLYKCIPEEDSDTDSDSDEEEDRPVKLGHRKKTRLLREAYYSYGDGAEANKTEGECDNSSDKEKKKFDEWDRKRKEEAEQRATFRPKVSLLGGSMYCGALPAWDGSSNSSDDSSSSSSESSVPMKTKDGKVGKKEGTASSNNDTLDSKSSKARTHNHVICRYELEESFSAAMIDGTERTRRIMLGEIPSDDDKDEEDSASDTGMSSGMGSETDTDVDTAKPKSKPGRRGSDSGVRKIKRRKKRRGPKQAKLLEAPMCPQCMIPCPPQALLFDEGYHAHDFYQFEKMEEWLSKADVIIFIGTSFKVTITDVALAHARDRGVPVYNFNVDGKGDGSLESSARLDANNVIGDVGETLPQLWIAVQEEMGARGLFNKFGELK